MPMHQPLCHETEFADCAWRLQCHVSAHIAVSSKVAGYAVECFGLRVSNHDSMLLPVGSCCPLAFDTVHQAHPMLAAVYSVIFTLNELLLCRRSQSATSSANMSVEMLPLLHQAPSPEQQPALQQSKGLAPDSEGSPAEPSKLDLSKASPDTVDSVGGHAGNLHAAGAKAGTLGMSQENSWLTAAPRKSTVLLSSASLCA